jgi:hypothetical protein
VETQTDSATNAHAVPGLLRVARGAAPASVPAKVDR